MRGHFGSSPFFSIVTIVLLLSGLSILARSQKPGTSGGGPSIAAQFNRHFEELKQDKARIEQAAKSPNISREQKDRATKSVAELDKLITTAEALMKDPALNTNPEKREEIYAWVQRAITYGNAAVLSARTRLEGTPLSAIERTVAARFEDYTMKIPHGFDGMSVPNVRTGTPFFGLGVNTAPVIAVTYMPMTPEYAKKNVYGYGSAAGMHAKRSESTIGSGYSSPFRR